MHNIDICYCNSCVIYLCVDYALAASTCKDLADLVQTSTGNTRRKAATALSQITVNLFTHPYIDDRRLVEAIVQSLVMEEEGGEVEEEDTGRTKEKKSSNGPPIELALILKSLICISRNHNTTEKIITAKIRTGKMGTERERREAASCLSIKLLPFVHSCCRSSRRCIA